MIAPFGKVHPTGFAICSSRFVALFRLVSCSFLPPLSVRGLVDEGLEINRIRFLGRWAHLRSLEHYIQVARAQQISLSLPSSVALKLKSFLKKSSFLLSLPAFFRARVPSENLVASPICSISHERDAAAAVRSWGRLSQAV